MVFIVSAEEVGIGGVVSWGDVVVVEIALFRGRSLDLDESWVERLEFHWCRGGCLAV